MSGRFRYSRPVLDVPILRLDPDLPLPAYARPGDAGIDLMARMARTPTVLAAGLALSQGA